jgi:DNA (cytosine-5)-methyltransferase 1
MNHKSRAYEEPAEPVGDVAELFAGVGGFRIGLARAGWRTVFSNQWEPSTAIQHASDVYSARFGPLGHSNQDIADVKEIETNFDLLVGGFPCQDYSVAKSASSATGLEGKKGVLWWEILRLVKAHRPKFIFLENVDRLLKSPSSQRGRDFAVMLRTLSDAGYMTEWRVVSAADYGFPQRRIRVFIVAKRTDTILDALEPERFIRESGVLARALPIESDGSVVAKVPLDSDPETVSNFFGRVTAKSPFQAAGVFVDDIAYTVPVQAKSPSERMVLGDVLVPDDQVPADFWIEPSKVEQWAYLKGAKSIERIHKESGFRYRYSEGKMTFPDSSQKPSRTILTGEGGATPSRFKHVIQTENGLRRLVPLELERLCGFPDDWTAPSGLPYRLTDARRAFFMGNALVVGLIEKVGLVLAGDLKA